MKVISFIILATFYFATSSSLSADIFSNELTCSNVNQSKLINFFNKDIKDKIISVTPDFCLSKPKNDPREKQFNELFSSLKKRSTKIKPSEPKDNEPVHVMKSLLLNRLWGHLTNEQRHFVFGAYGCSDNREIYLGFAEFQNEKKIRSKKDREKSENAFTTYKEICATKGFEALLPYVDKSTLLEYFFIVNLAKLNFEFHRNLFCNYINDYENDYILGSHHFDSEFNYPRFKRNVEWMLKTDLYNYDNYSKELSLFSKAEKINPVYYQALRDYSASSYVLINNCLRYKKDCENQTINDIMNIKKGISAISKKEMITYRGVTSLSVNVEKKLRKNCIFSDPAFSSTSLSYTIAKSFLRSDDGYMFVVRGKSGALIQDMSTIRNEEEVLYPNGTKFLVVGSDSHAEMGMKIRTIYLRELEPFEKVKGCPKESPKNDDGMKSPEEPLDKPDLVFP